MIKDNRCIQIYEGTPGGGGKKKRKRERIIVTKTDRGQSPFTF